MSTELVSFMKDVYARAKNRDFAWRNIHPNNAPCNGIDGVYTDMFFDDGDTFTYVKYSIEYHSRCDAAGISHPEEGTKYYVLHELKIYDVEEKFEIPEPSDDFLWADDDYSCLVNSYGRFRYVFDDEETAKAVVSSELLGMIYPMQYILDEDEQDEWVEFLRGWKD